MQQMMQKRMIINDIAIIIPTNIIIMLQSSIVLIPIGISNDIYTRILTLVTTWIRKACADSTLNG